MRSTSESLPLCRGMPPCRWRRCRSASACRATVFIAVRTDQHNTDWLDQLKRAVADIPEIVGVYRTSGDIDYLLQAVVPDVKAYDALYQHLIARVRLSDVSSSFVMEKIKSTPALPLSYA